MAPEPTEDPTRTVGNPGRASPPPAAATGVPLFGHYRLLKELGRGAQGVVHLAEDVNLGRQVALKMLTEGGARSPEARERFQREAALTSRIDHPGICGIHEVGEESGIPFIAMQFVRGTTLASILEGVKRGSSTGRSFAESIGGGGGGSGGELQDVVRLVERAALALHVAHEAGLVHRDIKPANIMVTPDGHPVILDFGLARDTGDEGQGLTQSGQIMGTPAYLAPEQILAERGGVDRRADIYALGVTLFECLTLQRPYEAQSFEQLFQKILSANLTNPRKLNPRIPQDLRTIIEVAMDRDPARRYQSAAAFADDLRRVRSFEPIRARAAGPWTRLRKWSRRHPGRAASAVGMVLATGLGGGTWLVQELQRRGAVSQNLTAAATALAAGDFGPALEAVGRALEREPGSVRAIELRAAIQAARDTAANAQKRAEAMTAAAAARGEAVAAQERLTAVRAELASLRRLVEQQRPAVVGSFAPDAARAELAARERRLRELEVAAEREVSAAQEALELAARLEAPWQGPSAETEAARAAFFLARWREAAAAGDTARAATFRAAVERHDAAGAHRAELLGHGTLLVQVEPADAVVHLFRFEDLAAHARGPVVPRLVPVPTQGVGRAALDLAAVFGSGQPCLLVTAVAAGSPAAALGLQAGDLVVGIDGHPATGLFAVLPEGHALREAGVAAVAPVAEVEGQPVDSGFDWSTARASEDAAGDRLRFAGDPREHRAPRATVPVQRPADLLAAGLPVAVRVQCLRSGAPVELTVPAGTAAGLQAEPTAYPLVCAAANRVAPGAPFAVEAGSYLLVASAAGLATQRVPVAVGRRADARIAVELQPAAAAPPGCVFVPGGPFRRGGDPAAFQSLPPAEVDVPGFWMQRYEVDNAAYFAFVNDPAIRAEIDAQPGARYLPRDGQGKLMAQQGADGRWQWAAYTATAPNSPVLGISWQDARAYVDWRNRQAEAAGEPWVYDLPSADQWEKAARGVDGRCHPWGDRFDPSLCVCGTRKALPLIDAPGGFEPRDESVYGVRDLAGSREEWLRDAVPQRDKNQPQQVYYKLGGSWSSTAEAIFRAASRPNAGELRVASGYGFRLVVRRR